MATLTVTATQDFSGDTLLDIDLIDFVTAAAATSTFAASQFGTGLVSQSVTIDGDANQNLVVVAGIVGAFSAANWTVTNWTSVAGSDIIVLQGSGGSDTITGPAAGGGTIHLIGGGGADTLVGGAANNFFWYNSASELVAGETLTGGSLNDTLFLFLAGAYNFSVATLSGIEGISFNGTASTATLTGSQMATITTINGGGGPNVQTLIVNGASTLDLSALIFFSWTTADVIVVNGTAGADTLRGSIQNDSLKGGGSVDSLDGGDGADILTGGRGRDTQTGGAGDDMFDFNSKADTGKKAATRDVITDFSVGDNAPGGLDDDLIDLRTIDANTLKAGNQAFRAPITTKFHHKAGELLIKQDLVNGDTLIRGDINGDGKADFQIELTGLLTLGKGDFIL